MMSLRLYFVFIAVTVWTFGANFQKVNASDASGGMAGFFADLVHPQDFLSNTDNTQTCPYNPTITCKPSNTFRTIDGSCNKPSSPYRGKSDTPYIRRWSNMYKDFVKVPMTESFLGGDLPTPREISLKFFTDAPGESIKKDNLHTVFARFVEHDLYHTKLFDGTKCCEGNNPTSPTCNSITLKPDDPYFQPYKRTCLPKANSPSSPTVECNTAVRQQINKNTHYLDLSNIYGSKDLAAKNLRTNTDGLLKESDTNNLLPKLDMNTCQLPDPNPKNIHCFMAGDIRANNDPLLMTLYTIWVRHHNYLAKEIKAILKNADDESIYQTARKIVIAEYQHIVYNEFLPALYSATDLKPLSTGYTTKSDKVKPDILDSFSIAYTGLVDTLIRKDFTFSSGTEALEKYWYNPTKLWETDGIKNLVKGMLTDAAGKIDRHIVKPLTDQYLQIAAGQGTDKIAVNIQQARENGIMNYFLQYSLGQKKFELSDYKELVELDTAVLDELKKMYPVVYDLEFLPGLFAEKHLPNEEIGLLLKELIETQFKNLKDGDDFYYEHKDIFTTDRLTEIRKITMAKILCDHADQAEVQKNAFLKVETTSNPTAKCTEFATPDTCLWATANWSDWIKSKCVFSFIVSTRRCEILPGSKCQCTGKPFKIEACPNNLVDGSTYAKVEKAFEVDYYKYFDKQGNQINKDGSDSNAVIYAILSNATKY